MEGLSFLSNETQAPYGDPGGAEVDVDHAVVVRDPFDPAPLSELFSRFEARIDDMRAQAAAVKVVDQDSHDTALTMIGEAKQVANKIEAERKRVKAPYFEMGKRIDGFANPLVGALRDIAAGLESAIRPWAIEQDRKRRAAEAEARRLAEEARRKAEAEARAKSEAAAIEAAQNNLPPPPPEPIVMPPVPEVPTETRSRVETATASVDLEWTADVVDLAVLLAVPDLVEAREKELLKAATPWVNAQVKAGRREIPGVSIYQTEKVKTRVRR